MKSKIKSKVFLILFVISIIVIALLFFITKQIAQRNNTEVTSAKLVPAVAADASGSDSDSYTKLMQNETFKTFVTLNPTETLISSQIMDLNDDGFDDEVIVTRKAGSQYFYIIPTLYNSSTGDYERIAQIQTKNSRIKNFSYFGMDMSGEHRTDLIYQGVEDDGISVLKIYMCKKTTSGSNAYELINIGDFKSDETIFIQQVERSESYALSLSKGASYSVWVYKSENFGKEGAEASSNQIQQEYKWNALMQTFELAQEYKVNANRIAAKELSRIQDGTVETFAGFLNGLWYKTANTDSNIRYIYFDYNLKEVILVLKDKIEVYEWGDSRLRHNGIYLSTVNSDIMNLHRRFDIALVNVDEIKITIRDEINLAIRETNLWDGQYKKLNMQSSFEGEEQTSEASKFVEALTEVTAWHTADSQTTISFDQNVYFFHSGEMTEKGVYAVMDIGSYRVIQFRSDSEYSLLNTSYAMEFGSKVVSETIKKKTVEKVVPDYDTIIFTPVKITPTDCFATEGKVYNFIK
ncbi:MAG: pallilysin-related adhesin [Treponema sp.]|nr:pallilysin-related adhesin [Treponema sp.]